MTWTAKRLAEEMPQTSLKAEGLTTKAIFDAAESGDDFALEMFESIGMYLGIGLVTLVNVTNVEMIALAGGLAGFVLSLTHSKRVGRGQGGFSAMPCQRAVLSCLCQAGQSGLIDRH